MAAHFLHDITVQIKLIYCEVIAVGDMGAACFALDNRNTVRNGKGLFYM